MTRRYFTTFAAMLIVLGLYSAYAQVSQRLLNRSQVKESKTARTVLQALPSMGPRASVEMAQQHLKDAPWAVAARAKIRADGLHLFFNEKRFVRDNTEIEVSPIAMVWSSDKGDGGTNSDSKPVVILADRGTFVFDEPVELSQIRTRMISQIQLRGRVSVQGDDGLKILGQNFVFDRANKNISSYHPVEFHMQDHHGYASNIQLNLSMLDGGQYADNPQMLGVKNLVITQHLELNLQPKSEEPPVLVTCEGSFRYEVASHQAILKDEVFVHRTDPHGMVDSLSCDRLELQFAEKGKTQVTTADSSPFGEASAMELLSLTASGDHVLAKSSYNQLEAVGEVLTYDLGQRTLTLRKRSGVEIHYKGAELFTPQLDVHLDEKQQPIFARCNGHGQVKYLDSRATQANNIGGALPIQAILAQANWQESLTFTPDEKSGRSLDVLTLTGKAVLQSPPHQTGLMSHTIKVWLSRDKESSTPVVQAGSDSVPPMARDLRIDRTLAEGDVAVVSPYLEGEYESLDIKFRPESKELLAQLKQDSPVQQTAGASSESSSTPAHRRLPESPFKIDATRLKLQVLHDPAFEEVHVAHVQTEGKIQANGILSGQKEPLHLEGQSVEISNAGQNRQRFQLLGNQERFASIQHGAMRIDGIDLFLDRQQDFTRVMGSGSIEFPVDSNWNGDKLARPQTLEVSWKEQMRFEGATAHFIGSVKATLGDSVITCEELKVHLDQPVSLKMNSLAVRPQIARVECQDRVHFEMKHYEEGVLVGIRYVNVWSYSMDQKTGAMTAQGPGDLEFWQKRTGKSPLGLPEATMSQSPEKKDEKSEQSAGWDYTRITFEGDMTGNYLQRQGTLNRMVNVLHGPVSEPLVRFVRDARPPDSVWIRCETLELLLRSLGGEQKGDSANPQNWSVEIQARENAEIEGDSFQASADVISYNHANRMFMMRGMENRHVRIWHFAHPNAPRSRYDVMMIRISPDGNILELDRTKGASGFR